MSGFDSVCPGSDPLCPLTDGRRCLISLLNNESLGGFLFFNAGLFVDHPKIQILKVLIFFYYYYKFNPLKKKKSNQTNQSLFKHCRIKKVSYKLL